MEQIKHSHLLINGLNLHVAEIGEGSKAVLFLHGFPEIWYTWRHQMLGVAKAGYRAISFDFRGYGDSDQPPEPEEVTWIDLVDDVVALLDALGITKVDMIGKDSGAIAMSLIASLHPNRVSSFITMGVPFLLPGPNAIQNHLMPKGFYITRWQEPGRAEADFGRLDVKTVVKNIYILFSGTETPCASDDQEIMDLVAPSTPLPPWFSEEDLENYASLYEKSGFRFPLQFPYRSLKKDCGITDPKITCPALLIMGEKDYLLKFAGMEESLRNGTVKKSVPGLEIVFMEEGSHFVNEQFPDKVNELLINFLNKHSN
ncbi:alpha/beta-Hydrolases superfamily protein [Euphorbia peplus]|nr:alpha/beta-Hydrolases superfamily protein [Euphorbia peplus]